MLTSLPGTEKTLALLYTAQCTSPYDSAAVALQAEAAREGGCMSRTRETAMTGVDAEEEGETQREGEMQERDEVAALPLVKERNQRSLFAFWNRV
jgi:hypothetical protein